MSKRQMVINYVPGEECRVAVIEDGRLEEFHSERMDAVSHVGNIYLGTVVNVEPAIQAAFVDFGLEQSGFLHVSDLHPRYFPGEDKETTEQVGKKTPRRERPPIQHCLRRGQEIAVQVLKEGVGTKGPTLTSYLSIPGRFLVMMPLMDRVGVSRKVEDDETRRKMREILDQLDLPDGFGFILRTAGLDRNKTEIKRDLAFLQRLWKDMERRWKKGAKPRLLYSESDLLVRALRDMLASDIDRIVVDNEAALQRAARFLKIVAPRTAANLARYTGRVPIFHAMGIEEQIQTIHAREVPLPSGGRLVIDETEALVAIDVNSGKSRDAGDAETNAFRTNLEAVDEICRQLRLRDLGGIVINDLIDMRFAKHRREVETRFADNMKKDRARSTLAPISEFGILELTRQRVRGSHESMHFGDCPICRGRGLVQKPDSVAADAMRDLATLLEFTAVFRAEMVVSPRIAGELLSSRRRALNRLERETGKRVDVRVSEAIPVDRVSFYAYDDRGADIDTTKLPRPRVGDEQLVPFEVTIDADDWAIDPEQEAAQVTAQEPPEPAPTDTNPEFLSDFDAIEGVDGEPPKPLPADGDGGKKRRRRRRGRGGRDGTDGPPRAQGPQNSGRRAPEREAPPEPHSEPARTSTPEPDSDAPRDGDAPHSDQPGSGDQAGDGTRRRRRRRRRGRGGRGRAGEGHPEGAHDGPAPEGGEAPDRSDAEHDAPGHDDHAPSNEHAESHAPSESHDGGPSDDSDSAPQGEGAGGDGERTGRRRRRRRRGGRGRTGGGGGGGGGGEEPRAAEPRADHGGRSNPPARERSNHQNRESSPPARSQPAPGAPAPQPKPRTLYSFNRRLKPSEKNRKGGGGGEE